MSTPHLITTPHFASVGGAPQHAYTPGDDFLERLITAHRA
jgi:hypothetical protein